MYSFEAGYEIEKTKFVNKWYPVSLAMDVGAFVVFYMPIILWAFDTFSIIDFLLISAYA